jgi:hypothetical protein
MSLKTPDAKLANTAIRSVLPRFALQPSYITPRLFQILLCYFTARKEANDSEARADRVRTIKESLLSKRDSHKNSSGSNVITRNPIQDMNGGLNPYWKNHHSWVSHRSLGWLTYNFGAKTVFLSTGFRSPAQPVARTQNVNHSGGRWDRVHLHRYRD